MIYNRLDSKSLYCGRASTPKLELEIGKVKPRLTVHYSVSTQTAVSNIASQAEVAAIIVNSPGSLPPFHCSFSFPQQDRADALHLGIRNLEK